MTLRIQDLRRIHCINFFYRDAGISLGSASSNFKSWNLYEVFADIYQTTSTYWEIYYVLSLTSVLRPGQSSGIADYDKLKLVCVVDPVLILLLASALLMRHAQMHSGFTAI